MGKCVKEKMFLQKMKILGIYDRNEQKQRIF